MSGLLSRLFGGGGGIPSEYYEGGEQMQPFDIGPPLPPRQTQGGMGGLSPEQRNILGFAALSDAFASLGGRQGQSLASMAPLAKMIGEQSENERFRLANQQIRQQLFGGGQQGAATPAAPISLTPAQATIAGGGQAGFTPGGLAINTRLESGGRADARPVGPDGRPRSSALGPNQFLESTFMEFANANPNIFQGMSREQILGERTNPEISRLATQWNASRNAEVLQNAGIPVSDASLGLAHVFGGGGAVRIAQAAPETPIEQVLSPAVLRANPNFAGRTAGDIVGSFVQSYGGQQAPAQPGAAAVPGVNIPSQRRPMISEQEFNMYTSLLPARQANQAIIQAMMRPAPAPIVIEGTAYDPITLRPLVTAPQRPGETERFFEERRRLAAIPADQRTPQQNEELELLNARLRGSGTNVNVNTERTFTGELGQQAVKDLTEARQAARIAPTLALRAERVNQLLNSGAITGTGANFFSSLANALTTAGIIPPDAAANTQMLGAELAGQALSASQLLKGPTSDRDITFLREASAGNITFNEQTIRRIARLNADLAERAVKEYNDIVGPLQGRANIPEEVRAIYRPIDWQEELRRARELAASSVVRTQPGAPTAPPPGSTIIPFQPPRSR
jgi:hypothetical protein